METGATKNSLLKEKVEKDLFHVVYKVPSGDGPYVRAKHAQVYYVYIDFHKSRQLVDKDPESAVVWFWKAINSGDRVGSALKDMAVVLKQLDRSEQAIEAIRSFRGFCPKNAQKSLDNVLIDLYKKCGKYDEQVVLLKRKLKSIYLGEAFNGRPTKSARSHGKKIQVSIKQETSRLLGNLGWAYTKKTNYMAAEVVYRKAQMIDPDTNKALNLGFCLIKQARYEEAYSFLQDVLQYKLPGSDDLKSRNRAQELLLELESKQTSLSCLSDSPGLNFEDDFVEALERMMNEWAPTRSRRLPVFEEISQF